MLAPPLWEVLSINNLEYLLSPIRVWFRTLTLFFVYPDWIVLCQAQALNLGSRSTASSWRIGWRHEWTRWSPGCQPESGWTAAARQDLQRGEDKLFEKKHHRNCWFRWQRAATRPQKALCPCLCKLPWKATWFWLLAHTWEQNNQDLVKVWKYGYLYFFHPIRSTVTQQEVVFFFYPT